MHVLQIIFKSFQNLTESSLMTIISHTTTTKASIIGQFTRSKKREIYIPQEGAHVNAETLQKNKSRTI